MNYRLFIDYFSVFYLSLRYVVNQNRMVEECQNSVTSQPLILKKFVWVQLDHGAASMFTNIQNSIRTLCLRIEVQLWS